mmetsp:Transcript_63434/g.136447  ORF Transcript_63434/g.136447 Transcript_63434/m.136447 type:complete len:203 (+) Transcript_63434:1124-1732(+)
MLTRVRDVLVFCCVGCVDCVNCVGCVNCVVYCMGVPVGVGITDHVLMGVAGIDVAPEANFVGSCRTCIVTCPPSGLETNAVGLSGIETMEAVDKYFRGSGFALPKPRRMLAPSVALAVDAEILSSATAAIRDSMSIPPRPAGAVFKGDCRGVAVGLAWTVMKVFLTCAPCGTADADMTARLLRSKTVRNRDARRSGEGSLDP